MLQYVRLPSRHVADNRRRLTRAAPKSSRGAKRSLQPLRTVSPRRNSLSFVKQRDAHGAFEMDVGNEVLPVPTMPALTADARIPTCFKWDEPAHKVELWGKWRRGAMYDVLSGTRVVRV
jgi:hypothetical protein